MNRILHDDDLVLTFDPTQEARHAALLRANEMARAMVERVRANDAGRQPDDDGVLPEPTRLRIVVGIERDDKSAKQRRFLHGVVLMQIADQARPNGDTFAMPVWKEFYRAMFLGHTWESVKMPGQKRATPRKVRISTEGLSVKGYSDYIDKVIAHAVTELGVVFDFNQQEREAVRYVRPARKAAKQEQAA